MVDVSVLIVCYKSREFIEPCLNGLYSYTSGCQFEVLLVDCSNDGTVDLVREKFTDVRIVENSENLGFGRGNNLLAEHATGQFLVLLNPDVIIEDNAIGELSRTAMSKPQSGVIGGWTRLPNGSRDPSCRQTIPTISRLLLEMIGGAKLLNGALKENATEVDHVETVSGAFMLVRIEAWRQAQGFDTSFFMYSEELDLCHRIRRNGWDIMMTPRAEVIHLVGGGQAMNPNRIKLLTTAKMHFFRKHWSRPIALMGGAISWTHGLVRFLAGTFGSVIIGRQRAKLLRDAYSAVVFQPQSWWWGFDGSESNGTSSNVSAAV